VKERDSRVLQELRARGDRTAIPRPIRIWIYGEPEELETIAEHLAGAGWEHTPPQPADRTYFIRAERMQDTSDVAIDAMIAEIERLVADSETAVFDGWETSLEIGQ
jgi:hypothetical protein